jgi:hypothetical protein
MNFVSFMGKLKALPLQLIFTFLFIFPVKSQIFKGGAVLGLNASQVDGDSYWGYDKFGLMVGGFVYTPLSHNLDIQFEIKYMSKGAQKGANDVSADQYLVYKSKLNYIEIPVLLRLNTVTKVGFEAGLGFGYLFSYSESDEYGSLPTEEATKFKSFELSGLLGLNYKINNQFSGNLRYSYSLLPITSGYSNPVTTFPVLKYILKGAYNNLFSLGVYYEFGAK